MENVPREEVEKRKAILRRFRELLLNQRKKFVKYLEILGHERTDIENGDIDALVSHVELEKSIVSEIFTFQKAIDPLEELYREAYPNSADHDIPEIKNTLENLRTEIIKRNSENCVLLRHRMDMLRNEIKSIRNPFSNRRSVYASTENPAIIDIKG